MANIFATLLTVRDRVKPRLDSGTATAVVIPVDCFGEFYILKNKLALFLICLPVAETRNGRP